MAGAESGDSSDVISLYSKSYGLILVSANRAAVEEEEVSLFGEREREREREAFSCFEGLSPKNNRFSYTS